MREALTKKCTGEAHSNPYIDHCYVCMPFWYEYPICPDCQIKLKEGKKVLVCPECHKRFVWNRRAESISQVK